MGLFDINDRVEELKREIEQRKAELKRLAPLQAYAKPVVGVSLVILFLALFMIFGD